MDAIERALLEREEKEETDKQITYDYTPLHGKQPECVCESAAAYAITSKDPADNSPLGKKKQGEYTLADYYALPDDKRYELIDGVLIEMNSPETVHQDIAAYIHMMLYDYIRKTGRPCKVYESPIDVQLDCDDRTMVQPDVLVLCNRNLLRRFGIYGAPDFILEVLSPSTRKKDMSLKLTKYMNAGVKEYWIIDPNKKCLITYDFTDEQFVPVIHPLNTSVPVAISGGDLLIDLAPVAEVIEELADLE